MDFNKCKRCGAFFLSDNCVCPNCQPKDVAELSILKDFLTEDNSITSIEKLACDTGISVKNLNRFLEQSEFIPYTSQFTTSTNKNITTEL